MPLRHSLQPKRGKSSQSNNADLLKRVDGKQGANARPLIQRNTGLPDYSHAGDGSEMQTVSLEQAVAMIPDGASLMIGGFMAVGTPERVVDEIVRQNKRNLTVQRYRIPPDVELGS